MILKITFFSIFCVSLIGCSALREQEFDQRDIEKFKHYKQKQPVLHNGSIQATYFGTSSLLFQDKDTAILVDGFFSRPAIKRPFFKKLKQLPEEQIQHIIESKLLGSKLEVIIVLHSHHDHAMDALCVAKIFKTKIIGSPSTKFIDCQNEDLSNRFFNLFESKQKSEYLSREMEFGQFKITLIKSEHAPIAGFFGPIAELFLGHDRPIKNKLTTPAPLLAYREGENYAVLIEHEQAGSILVHASAGFIPDRYRKIFRNQQLDWLFLGVGSFTEDTNHIQPYLKNTLVDSGAKNIVPIHWDDFTRFSTQTLYPAKKLMGNFKQEISTLEEEICSQSKKRSNDGKAINMYLLNFAESVVIRKAQQQPSNSFTNILGCTLEWPAQTSDVPKN